jgi:hypothetical protein
MKRRIMDFMLEEINNYLFGAYTQRLILRDRRPSAAGCPAFWPNGTKELK